MTIKLNLEHWTLSTAESDEYVISFADIWSTFGQIYDDDDVFITNILKPTFCLRLLKAFSLQHVQEAPNDDFLRSIQVIEFR